MMKGWYSGPPPQSHDGSAWSEIVWLTLDDGSVRLSQALLRLGSPAPTRKATGIHDWFSVVRAGEVDEPDHQLSVCKRADGRKAKLKVVAWQRLSKPCAYRSRES